MRFGTDDIAAHRDLIEATRPRPLFDFRDQASAHARAPVRLGYNQADDLANTPHGQNFPLLSFDPAGDRFRRDFGHKHDVVGPRQEPF
jgi:hypothetical protein